MEELEEYGASEYTVMELLFYAGMGEYDYETFEWTPAQSGVYAFDIEVFDVGFMYTNFLRGVEAMSRGKLEFSEIVEEDSDVDFESGTGRKKVTVTHDGRTQIFRPELLYDWFDLRFANDLSRWLGADADGSRLRFLFDGYQVVYVFYCDDAWAASFAEATGYTLTEKLHDAAY